MKAFLRFAALLLFLGAGLARAQTEVIVDNTNAGFSATGGWGLSTFKPGYYGTNYLSILDGGASELATWSVSVPAAGTYSVYGWWNYDVNRATNATFTVNHAAGATQVVVDQTLSGSQWSLLGTFSFNQGATSITLSGQGDGRVVADAVRIVSGFPPPPPAGPFSLEPSADAYTKATSLLSNFGTSSTIRVANPTNNKETGYLKFNLGSVGGTVTSAILNLRGHGPSGTTEVNVYPVADTSWSETGITWSNQPAPGAAIATVTINGSSDQWYAIDLTSYVQAEKAAGRNAISLALKPNGGGSGLEWVFNSREGASSSHPYLSGTSVAAPTLHFVQVDHLNTPRAVYNANQQLRWKWDQQEPFGANPPDENPSALGAFEFPLRFPGQYFDKETNLAYNYFRDYDSATGRYVESDPIGLGGGVNTYLYGRANPLLFFDPQGLNPPTGNGDSACVAACTVAGAAIGGIGGQYGGAGIGGAIGGIGGTLVAPGPGTVVGGTSGVIIGGAVGRPVGIAIGGLIGNAIGRAVCAVPDGDSDEEKKRRNCQALKDSILNTCAGLKGRAKFRCFEAANTSYRQCMGYE